LRGRGMGVEEDGNGGWRDKSWGKETGRKATYARRWGQ